MKFYKPGQEKEEKTEFLTTHRFDRQGWSIQGACCWFFFFYLVSILNASLFRITI